MLEFRHPRQNCRAEMKGTEVGPEIQKSTIAGVQKFVCDIMDEVIKETGSWHSDLEEGLKALSDQLSQADQKLSKLSHPQASKKK